MKTVLRNPVIFADVPDIDVIRVGEAYYMVSTTMYMCPGCPIMKSTDLKHWEIVNYVFDIIDESEESRLLNGKNIYSKGQWAASIREHNGMFYVCFSCNHINKTFLCSTDDIENGIWKRVDLGAWVHDPGIYFEGDTPYVLSGTGDIRIVELENDLSGVKKDGVDKILISTPHGQIIRCEGVHTYHIGDYYYLFFIEWAGDGLRRRRAVIYRSTELFGEYERRIVLDDDMGYFNRGIAQGALIDTINGEWYAMLFQDHDSVGRVPYIIPVKWEDGWPVLGDNGKVKECVEINLEENPIELVVGNDSFDYEEEKLGKQWQWNHNPDNEHWSVTERPGYLRLKTSHLTRCVLNARNTLTQRTLGPKCQVTTAIEVANMKDGDAAGLVALQSRFGTIGIRVIDGRKYICMTAKDGVGGEYLMEHVETELPRIYLRIIFDFKNGRDIASFYYSKDGENYVFIGSNVKMLYTLDHFMGYRAGLYCYASKETGGYVDFDFYEIEVLE